MGSRDRRIMVRGQPGQKSQRDLSPINNPSVVLYICNPGYAGSVGRRIVGSDLPGKKQKTYLKKKILKQKRGGYSLSGRAPP
jgi:hypothetical protein